MQHTNSELIAALLEQIAELNRQLASATSPPRASYPTLRIRIGKLVNRRESTKWSDKESRALYKLNPTEADIAYLEDSDYVNHQYRRRDLFTLLNNWGGELDRMNSVAMPKGGIDPTKSILG